MIFLIINDDQHQLVDTDEQGKAVVNVEYK